MRTTFHKNQYGRWVDNDGRYVTIERVRKSEARQALLRSMSERRRLMNMAETNRWRMTRDYGYDHWKAKRAKFAYHLRWYAWAFPQFA